MNTLNKTIENNELMNKAEKAKQASGKLAAKSTAQKNNALITISKELVKSCAAILDANTKDLERAKRSGLSAALLDRLMLNESRVKAMADALRNLASLPDPVGECLEQWTRPNGLQIRKVRVPIGVVGMVYEARPNVTVDAAGLCLKTGNAVFLRGSRSALESNRALVAVIRRALSRADLPEDGIQLLEDTRHETADRFFKLNGLIDVLIPRGSAGLIQTVIENATIPVLETGAGVCHLFIDESAKPDMAVQIAINAKVQRPSVCNAIETILVHEKWFDAFGTDLIEALRTAGVECRIDPLISNAFPDLPVAEEDDWGTEYLDKIVSIKVVHDVHEAIRHINRFGTKHSESIISETRPHVERFFQSVDASTLYHNASTRFTDGEMFGFGAEIGISTQKLHARGPMGLPALTTIKYLVEGTGQIRK